MDKTVPPGAALLLDFIRETEVGTKDRRGYDIIYANRQGKLPKPITSMTIAELQRHQAKGWPASSTASGGYQFMRVTLAGLRNELGLRDEQIFDPDLQDRLGFHLLKRRGYEQFVAGKMSRADFGKRLAQEWASFPVLEDTIGSERKVKRGQSYYAGDGVNKALVSPAKVEKVLSTVLAVASAAPPPAEAPEPVTAPEQPPKDNVRPEPPVASQKGWGARLLDWFLSWF